MGDGLGQAGSSVDRPDELSLHRAVFRNDVKQVAKDIRDGADVAFKDVHGNTALHLAVMLGHRDCIALLLSHDSPVKAKNAQGWSPLAEAISYGDRPTVLTLLRKLKFQSRDAIQGKKPHLVTVLSDLADFYMELKWDFASWIPLVSKILPSDVCKIYKRGTALRMDTTLVDFNERTWERGDISFIFDASADDPAQSLVILDNKAKVFQRVKYEESDVDLEDEVDVLMSSDIVNAQMSTKTITFSRASAGWIFRSEKSEKIGEYQADFFNVDGMFLDSRKRREHLSPEDIKKNKALLAGLQMGTINEEELREQRRRKSLPPPAFNRVPFHDYIGAPPGFPPHIGRPHADKATRKHLKATVAMSTEFPLDLPTLLDILEIAAPFKHLNKLRRFCQVRLPPGFPVRIEIPLLPTIVAKITFQKLQFKDDLDPKLFLAPKAYREDSTRFPDL